MLLAMICPPLADSQNCLVRSALNALACPAEFAEVAQVRLVPPATNALACPAELARSPKCGLGTPGD